ncbi:TPA: bifunctional adenosylcobinamide kinase/adenosylcobinamide-phosphate guanylyltransferase [Enterococcus faecalis]|uniref:bifunctional adenosylcobinamide kinase/adenosylcobinamide-phosphate guanylyltransferase n=1 Tax=Enterococcus faecalis TaxID=1351 RepID=UPI000CF6C7B9|nr:bifunctional adenosylcobinamide kinase/adenosylcobinamide-phosphate guanylyltransferase [Enterococcus faecalis]PQC14604.1 bifunctional adenosylcobinamide kinase/adenosylcobinamide-phosphate guanylyltransferase [Enterococcus faecalis]HAP3815341.1 bifunctional adenosylcobinamide kinase/adenosylcobinamide-phosphate guanylyltransferase [Enterococcus faecalis]
MSLTLITGGAKSGKSSFAESLLKNKNVCYIATNSRDFVDFEMEDRVKKHKEQRDEKWHTEERYKNIGQYIKKNKNQYDAFLIDCATMLTTNLLFEYIEKNYFTLDFESLSPHQIKQLELKIEDEWSKLLREISYLNVPIIIVTNEVGSSIVPDNKLGRWFQDMLGKINQNIAKKSLDVYLVICSIPQKLK